MGVYIKNFEEIRYALRGLANAGHLCCFFALDDRPSLSAALQHLHECSRWIDTMAVATEIFAFVPVQERSEPTEFLMIGERLMTREESEYEASLPTIDYVLNPTVQLASRFGVLPSELPGLIFFEALPDGLPGNACFVSVPERYFTSETKITERFLAIIFSELITSLEHANRSDINSVVASLQQFLTQDCRARIANPKLRKPLVQAIETDFDNARSRAFEPENLKAIYGQIPSNIRASIKLFLSYAKEDAETVRHFYNRLKRAGFSPWMDEEDLLPGEQWGDRIDRVMRLADFIVIFLSHRSVRKRGYVQVELKRALKRWEEHLQDDIYLIPVQLDNCPVPESLGNFHWLNFGRYYDGWGRMFSAIVEGYRRRENTETV
jgi:hypothetical protein